jgi:hypothetical protein
LENVYSLIATNAALPIVDPFSGQPCGELEVVLATGSHKQLDLLEETVTRETRGVGARTAMQEEPQADVAQSAEEENVEEKSAEAKSSRDDAGVVAEVDAELEEFLAEEANATRAEEEEVRAKTAPTLAASSTGYLSSGSSFSGRSVGSGSSSGIAPDDVRAELEALRGQLTRVLADNLELKERLVQPQTFSQPTAHTLTESHSHAQVDSAEAVMKKEVSTEIHVSPASLPPAHSATGGGLASPIPAGHGDDFFRAWEQRLALVSAGNYLILVTWQYYFLVFGHIPTCFLSLSRIVECCSHKSKWF